jgi:alkyl sulfatase BDS1-like metallo-beta-lactamase superfamily hydrolase
LTFTRGDLTFHLHHGRGETDDATWTWVPERKIVHPGDLFIWAVPNAGNPQKVQRYASDWAASLRQMAGLDPELLLAGHGLPIFGADRVRAAVEEPPDLEDRDDRLAERGRIGLDRVIHEVEVPAHLATSPTCGGLRPPQFIVRNVWRRYGGWYDGEPDNLLPAADRSERGMVALRVASRRSSALVSSPRKATCASLAISSSAR